MRTLFKRLLTDSAAFGVTTMGNKIVAFLLVPIYGWYLSKQQFADLGQVNMVTLLLTYLCILGTDSALAFYYFDAKETRDRRLYLTNAVFFSAGICAILTILSYFLAEPFNLLIFDDATRNELLLPLAALATVGAIIIQQILAYARYNRQVALFNIFSICYVAGSNILSAYILVFHERSLIGFFYGQLIGQGIVAILLIWKFRHEFIFQFSRKHLLNLIQYGAPLVPSLLSFWVLTMGSKTILYHSASPDEAATYEAAIRVATFINLLTAPFFLAWRPFSMSIKEREDAPRIFGIVARMMLVIGTILIMCMQFVMQPIVGLYLPKYESGYLYVWFLSVATILNVLHMVFGVGLLIEKKTSLISRGFIIAAILNIGGALLIIPYVRIWGAVGITLFSYLFVIVYVIRQNQKCYPIDITLRSVMSYLAIYLSSMTFVSWLQMGNLSHLWVYYLLALIVTVIGAFASKLISWQLLNSIKYIFSDK